MEAPGSDKLYVCFTMDVERIRALCPPGGTPTWEFGETCVRTYCATLADRGYPATLFIVPDTAAQQPGLLRQMRGEGHECGLHIHPQGWGDNFKDPDAHDYLGGYTGEQQAEMLGRAKRQWSDALGFAPETFRGGNFSANDETFRVLGALGFKSSSTSQPGRVAPNFKAVWSGAPRGVHRAHRGFRLAEGDMELVEVPVTVDATRTDHWTGVGDARLEDWELPDILHAVEDSLAWQVAHRAPILHLCLFTHNYISYGTDHVEIAGGANRRAVLLGLIDALPAIAARYGRAVEGCTVTALRERYLERTGPRSEASPGVKVS